MRIPIAFHAYAVASASTARIEVSPQKILRPVRFEVSPLMAARFNLKAIRIGMDQVFPFTTPGGQINCQLFIPRGDKGQDWKIGKIVPGDRFEIAVMNCSPAYSDFYAVFWCVGEDLHE